MLDVIRLRIPIFEKIGNNLQEKSSWNSWQVVLLGMVFALAFCPYSGVLYFGMLIPITIASPDGLLLPLIFALATGLPVILIAWILAFAVSELGTFYKRLKTFDLWFRRMMAVVFMAVGLYYIVIFFVQ